MPQNGSQNDEDAKTFNIFISFFIFSRVEATLYEGVSIRWMDGPSVRR